jgi:hypothetical protein
MEIPLTHSIQFGMAEHLSLADDLVVDEATVGVGALVFMKHLVVLEPLP